MYHVTQLSMTNPVNTAINIHNEQLKFANKKMFLEQIIYFIVLELELFDTSHF